MLYSKRSPGTQLNLSFTSHDPEAPKQFEKYAKNHIELAKTSFGFDLSYDLASIAKLDQMIDGIGKPKYPEQMILLFGSFLGEAFRHLFDGRWVWNEQFKSWAIVFPSAKGKEEGAFVFAKVQKRFNNGMEDSLSFYGKVTDSIAKGRIP